MLCRLKFKLCVLILVLLVAVSNEMPPIKSNDIFWYPKENGQGYVPALLKPPESLEVAAAPGNPNDIRFFLYTLKNQDIYDEIFNATRSIEDSHWNKDAPVKIFAHGFSSSFDGNSGDEMRKGYMANGFPTNVNLVLVQWERLAAPPFYYIAADNTKLVGEKVAHFVSFLIKNQFTTLDKVHLAGHSLGAHAMGYAGRLFKEFNNESIIPRITGLDPALPLFESVPDDDRIDPSDAEFVDIIHTASGSIFQGELSFIQPRGTVDFYPNKGRDQPGCWPDFFGVCSHGRGYEYFSESIQNDNFIGCRCNDNAWDPEIEDDFKSCSCDKGVANMGEWTSHNARGIYFLTTNPKSPFANAHRYLARV